MVGLGRIIRLQGIKGELRFRPYQGAETILAPGKVIYIGEENNLIAYRLEALKRAKRDLILKITGLNSPETTFPLIGQEVLIKEEALPPLGEGEFYEYQLIGARVITRGNEAVGSVVGFWEFNGKIIMLVEQEKKEILIPFEEAICRSIDIVSKIIIIEPPQGLLDLNEI